MPQQPPTQSQLGHVQNFEPSADLRIQAPYQTEQMEAGTPTLYVAADSAWGWSTLGRVTGAHEPSHLPARYLASPISLLESAMPDMVSQTNINPNPDMNVGEGSAATLGPPRLVTMHSTSDMYASNSDVWQQQRPPLLPENAQAPIVGEFLPGAKGTAGSMAPGASDDTFTTDDKRTVTIHWQLADGIRLQAKVLITDQIHNPMTSLWPTDLLLNIGAVGIDTMDIQKWIRKNKASVARIKCASETDNHGFDDLLELLRSHGAYATAGWEAGGSYQTRLLLAPFYKDLICASFIVNGIPTPPTSRPHEPDRVKSPVAPNSLAPQWSGPEPLPDPMVMPTSPERPRHEAAHGAPTPQQPEAQPQPCTHPQADYVPVEDTMEPSQVDANLSEAITFAPALAVPKPHPQSGQQTFTQALLQHSVAQLSRHAVTWDMLSGSRTDAGATSWVANSSKSLGSKWPMKGASDPWLGIGEADAIEPRADSGLGIGGDGPMNVVGTCVTRSPGADLEDMWPQ